MIDQERERPWMQGLLVGGSFMLGAFVPIVPFLLALPFPRFWAYLLTALLGRLAAPTYTAAAPARSAHVTPAIMRAPHALPRILLRVGMWVYSGDTTAQAYTGQHMSRGI